MLRFTNHTINISFCKQLIVTFIVLFSVIFNLANTREVLWAVNCGGEAHTDANNIHYQADPLDVGFSSDFGKNIFIQRVVPQDQILYQTERYSTSTFGYDLPIYKDGDYVLVIKFCEVWFTEPNQKVFDVVLNGEHTVVSELDIFSLVGRGAAYDEIIPFTVKSGTLHVNKESSHIDGNKISLEFIKGELDNPKVNAIYVMKGTVDDVPKLAPISHPETVEEHDDENEEPTVSAKPQKPRKPSGPRAKDPYASEDTSAMLLPVFVALGAFIPLLYCLCKLR